MLSKRRLQIAINELEAYIFAPVDDPDYDPTRDLIILETFYAILNAK